MTDAAPPVSGPDESVASLSEDHLAAMANEPPSVFDADETPAVTALTPFEQVRPRAWGWMQPGSGS